MFSKGLLFIIVLFVSCAPTEQKQNDVCSFILRDNLVVLNGNVKQLYVTYVDNRDPYLHSNVFDMAALNRKKDVTNIATGFDGEGLKFVCTTIHDKSGRKSEMINYLIIHKHRSMEDIFYNNPKEIDSIKNAVEIYKYDDEGKIIRRASKLIKATAESFYKYNSIGDLTESDNIPVLTYFKYDNHHNLMESNSYINGHFEGKNTYKYVSFDKHGNWTKAIEVSKFDYESSGNSRTITRTITYY